MIDAVLLSDKSIVSHDKSQGATLLYRVFCATKSLRWQCNKTARRQEMLRVSHALYLSDSGDVVWRKLGWEESSKYV